MPRARYISRVVAFVLIGCAITLGVMHLNAHAEDNNSSSPAAVDGAFTLATTDGTVVSENTFRGKWLLIYFGYTFCPDICPTTLNSVASILEDLGQEAQNVKALFITIDPKRDTPQVLADYVKAFDPRIVALTGTRLQTAAVARAYGVIYERQDIDGGDYLYNHTSYIYLMDRTGKFIEAFAGDAAHAKIMQRLSQVMHSESGKTPRN